MLNAELARPLRRTVEVAFGKGLFFLILILILILISFVDSED